MILVAVHPGRHAKVDDWEFVTVARFKWRAHDNGYGNIYAVTGSQPNLIKMEHLILPTEVEAAMAYDKAAMEQYGPAARLNFPLGHC